MPVRPGSVGVRRLPVGRSERLTQPRAQAASLEAYSISMHDIASQVLARYVDLPIIDDTGLTGKFDVHLVSILPAAPRGPVLLNGELVGSLPADDSAPSIFSWVEQHMGLKLSSGKGPVEFLVIGRAERPTGKLSVTRFDKYPPHSVR